MNSPEQNQPDAPNPFDTGPQPASGGGAPRANSTATPWLPRFGIAEMMLAMLIFCVMAAAFSYLRSAIENDQGRPIFVIFTLASPIALVLVLSAYLALKRFLRGR